MHPDQTAQYLQKLDAKLNQFVKSLKHRFGQSAPILSFSSSKITFQVKITLLHTDYCQVSYYDGENKKASIVELFGKSNILLLKYAADDEIPDYFKIFVNSKFHFDVCTITVISHKGINETRFEINNNFPSGQWYFCYLN
jgi:hypothetical protein